MWFKNGLKAQKLQKQHALKGQKLLAQGLSDKPLLWLVCRGSFIEADAVREL